MQPTASVFTPTTSLDDAAWTAPSFSSPRAMPAKINWPLEEGWPAVRAGLMRSVTEVGLPCQLDIDVADAVPPPNPLQSSLVLNLSRALLANVNTHAQATGVEVRMSATASDLTLLVRDNGKGAPPSAFDPPGMHSLTRLRQDVASLGGWLQIDSHPGQGTQAILSLPLYRGVRAG